MNDVPTADDSPRPPRRFQFALWHIFALMLAVGVCLSLVTQLKHIGLVIFGYLLGAGIGAIWRHWRLVSASASGLAVYVVTFLASWVQMGYAPYVDRAPFAFNSFALKMLAEELSVYKDVKGEYPEHLGELSTGNVADLQRSADQDFLDWWGNEIHYRKTEDGFELATLGRDGILGGYGVDGDVFWGREDHANLRLTMRQFLFDTPGGGGVFFVATFASLVVAFTCLKTQGGKVAPTKWQFVGVAATAISALLVAVFLASFYIAAAQSGH